MSKTIILVPAFTHLEQECEGPLQQLAKQGIDIAILKGNADIVQARQMLASQALKGDYDNLFWIDADMGFTTDDVLKIIKQADELSLPILGGIYAKKGKKEVSCMTLNDDSLSLGPGSGLIEILYAATGFLLTKRDVYQDMINAGLAEYCSNGGFYSWFIPQVKNGRYLGEDYSFCERARTLGMKIMIDGTIKLKHYGKYGYSWDDLV